MKKLTENHKQPEQQTKVLDLDSITLGNMDNTEEPDVYTSYEVPPKKVFDHNLKRLKSFKNIRKAYKCKNLQAIFIDNLSVLLKEYPPLKSENELNDDLLLEILNIAEEYFIDKSKDVREQQKKDSIKKLMLPYFRNDEMLLEKTISLMQHKVKKSNVFKRVFKRTKFFFLKQI